MSEGTWLVYDVIVAPYQDGEGKQRPIKEIQTLPTPKAKAHCSCS